MIRQKISVKEIRAVAAAERNKQLIREAFQKLTNTTSWKEAQEDYPEYTKDSTLSQFQGLDFKGELPEVCTMNTRICIVESVIQRLLMYHERTMQF